MTSLLLMRILLILENINDILMCNNQYYYCIQWYYWNENDKYY